MAREKRCHPSHPIPECSPWLQLLCIYFSHSHSWQVSYVIMVPSPPALSCSDYCPCPPLFCQVFGDHLVIHCLEHTTKPTGTREVLGLLPVCHYKDDMLVSVLKQHTQSSCGVLPLKSAKTWNTRSRSNRKQGIQLDLIQTSIFWEKICYHSYSSLLRFSRDWFNAFPILTLLVMLCASQMIFPCFIPRFPAGKWGIIKTSCLTRLVSW